MRNRNLLIGLGIGCLVLAGCGALVVALGAGSNCLTRPLRTVVSP